ncbi:MAG TPA: 50S ribosomal protein L25 [Bryobacteraceae bacterium]|nr:50S ribosomal protein L25 [Bryobacteraceae bacterium]
MRKDITLVAHPRATRGKNEANRLRAKQLSPAVIYGAGKESVAIALSPKELNKILYSSGGHNTIFNLDVEGVENTPVMVVDWQLDPITDRLLHADLLRIDLNKRLKVKVHVMLHGDPKGVKLMGGLLEVITREIEIECLPDEIPEHLDADITELVIGQSLRAGEIALRGSMRLLSQSEQVIAHVVGAKAEEAAAVAEPVAAAAEPEVVKKGKKEEEAEAAAPKKKK